MCPHLTGRLRPGYILNKLAIIARIVSRAALAPLILLSTQKVSATMNKLSISNAAFRVKRRIRNGFNGLLLRHNLSGLRGVSLKFIFTCRQGIFLFDRGKISKLVEGPHFGITATSSDTVLAAEWVGNREVQKTVVYRYHFDGALLTDKRKLTFRDRRGQILQPFGIHQIRYLGGFLWVINTRENVVWKCSLEGDVLDEWSEEGKMPFDEQKYEECNQLRKQTETYRHYNSITFHDGHFYVLAHNCSQEQDNLQKRSYIVKLDEDLTVVGRLEDMGRACHDVVFIDGHLYVCNSMEGSLMENGKPVMEFGSFLRGIGVIGSIMIIGGSPYQIARHKRDDAHSQLFFVDYRARRQLFSLQLGRLGNVLDVLPLEN